MESGRQKVTRKDVAREAGVSETIVSYVLNKNRYVKEEKRQRVLEVVEKLQYHPNNIARDSSRKRQPADSFSCRRTEQWLFFRTGKPDEQGCLLDGDI